MNGARTKIADRLTMLTGSISFMVLKSISGINLIINVKNAISGYFRDNRGARDRKDIVIAANNGFIRKESEEEKCGPSIKRNGLEEMSWSNDFFPGKEINFEPRASWPEMLPEECLRYQ